MGRQDNVEIFEDTQRLYSSNVRLTSAIKNSSAAQECFTGTWDGTGMAQSIGFIRNQRRL